MTISLAEISTHLEATYGFIFANCSGKLRCKPVSFKEYLFNHTYFKYENNNLIVEPECDDLKKLKNALFRDFEHFYIKSTIQYIDFLNQHGSSKTWNIVTHYYFLFFCITSLCKYIGRSCIYFNSDEIKMITKNIVSPSINLSLSAGLYTYFIEKTNTSLRIRLFKDTSGMGIHEKAWKLFYNEFISVLTDKLDKKNINFIVIKQIKKIMNAYKENFPSMLRNDFNYQAHHSIDELQNNIPALVNINQADDNLEKILQIEPKRNDSIDKKLQCCIYIGAFTYRLLKELQSNITDHLNSSRNEFDELQKTFLTNKLHLKI